MKNEMSTLSSRLIFAMQEKGMSQGALAKASGLAQPTIWRIVSGKAQGSSKITDIAKALDVTPNWLMHGTEPMRPNGIMTPGVRLQFEVPDEGEIAKFDPWEEGAPVLEGDVEVPYLKDIEFACGDGGCSAEDYNNYHMRFSRSLLRRAGANTDGYGVICFPVRGDSMEPLIPDGAIVAVNTSDKKIVDGKLYAISEDGWKRVKILYRTGPNDISIRSYNESEHPSEDKSLNQIEIIGRVFWYSQLI